MAFLAAPANQPTGATDHSNALIDRTLGQLPVSPIGFVASPPDICPVGGGGGGDGESTHAYAG